MNVINCVNHYEIHDVDMKIHLKSSAKTGLLKVKKGHFDPKLHLFLFQCTYFISFETEVHCGFGMLRVEDFKIVKLVCGTIK